MCDTDKAKCANCGAGAALQCSRCKKVFYCGTAHQKEHWKQHKPDCKGLFEVKWNDTLGRHLVATSRIEAHSEIFNELPLVFGPKFYGDDFDESGRAPVKCVGCFKQIPGQKSTCPQCQWPACSANCEGLKMSKLHGLECSVLALGTRIHAHALNDPDFFRMESILPLKCLLMQIKNPQKYADLMEMESNVDKLKGSDMEKEFTDGVVPYLNDHFLQCLLKLDKDSGRNQFSAINVQESLLKICGIIETNSMCIRLDDKTELSGIYKMGCLLEHSCVPNCYFSFDAKSGFKLRVRAGRDIEKGEHISIMYTNSLWGTTQRQEHLRLTKCFTCKCPRCQDPSEFGTHFSSLKCLGTTAKCSGYLLPIDPTLAHAEWVCSNDACQNRLNNQQVLEFMQNIENDVESLLADNKTKVEAIESVIKKLSPFLHPNHYQMFALKHNLVQLYGFRPGYEYHQMSLEQLDDKLSLCKELLAILKSLDPHFVRLSVYAGTLAVELYYTLREIQRRGIDRHEFVGNVRDYMDEILVFGKLTLAKDLDVPEAKMLYDRMNSI